MGTIFEELVRRFNEENNEEAGEHWTPRDAVKLMAKLIFLPIADQIESGTYLLYDGACGTGGMLTVAEETLQQLAEEHGKQVATHLYGQEINAETYAICKADLLLKGEGEAADNIVGGPEHSTLSNDAFPSREFDFMLSNPPYGKSWKSDLERMGGKEGIKDPRFVIEHAGDPEYSLITRSSDGQMLFLANMLSKMKHGTKLGSRIAEVHNGSLALHRRRRPGREQHPPLDHRERLARGHRRPAAQHVLQHRHRDLHLGAHQPQARRTARGKVQLIDATQWFKPLRKNLGKKNCELSDEDIQRICDTLPHVRGDRAVEDLPERRLRLLEGDRRATAAPQGHRPGPRLHAEGDQGARRRPAARRRGTLRRSSGRSTRRARRPTPARPVSRRRSAASPCVVEYEPDTDLRDTEQVPLLEEGGIEAFLRREVLPHAADAWYVPDSVKTGYEISFTRYFYKPQPLRTLEEIRADILALEKETEGLLGEIIGSGGR